MKPKKIARYLLSTCLLIVLLPVIGMWIPRKWHHDSQASCQYRVCVAKFGYHSNIIVPVQNAIFDWRNYLKGNKRSDYRYLAFGWGERAWYIDPPTQRDRKIFSGLRALLLPNPSAIKIQGFKTFPQHETIKCVGVSQTNYLKLMNFIEQSFQKNPNNKIVKIADKPQWNATFYEAKGTYSLLNNSNHWTANGLRTAGINTPLWAGHSAAIMRFIENRC